MNGCVKLPDEQDDQSNDHNTSNSSENDRQNIDRFRAHFNKDNGY